MEQTGMSELTTLTVIERTQGLLASELDNEIVMLNVQRGNYYGLSGVAKRVWELLDGPKSIGEVCQLLQAEFEVDADTCSRDVLVFVEQLIRENMVRVVS